MFKLSFKIDNETFKDNLEYEIDAILQDIGKQITHYYTSGAVFDSNGNKIGKWALT